MCLRNSTDIRDLLVQCHGQPHQGLAATRRQPTGATDEIIQWAACKWGIDEEIVRAQIAKESYWKHATDGDLSTDQSRCYRSRTTDGSACPDRTVSGSAIRTTWCNDGLGTLQRLQPRLHLVLCP